MRLGRLIMNLHYHYYEIKDLMNTTNISNHSVPIKMFAKQTYRRYNSSIHQMSKLYAIRSKPAFMRKAEVMVRRKKMSRNFRGTTRTKCYGCCFMVRTPSLLLLKMNRLALFVPKK